MGIAHTHNLAATQNNLFGLHSGAVPLYTETLNFTRQWLKDLGFSINQQDQRHWVVTHQAPLPEMHFYSEQELAQFASHKAQHYAKRLLLENRA